MMNKKADTYHILWNTIIRLPYIAVLYLIFFFLLNSLISTSTDSSNLVDSIVMKRILSTLAYRDGETSRLYPGIIDTGKFSTQVIDKAFVLNDRKIAARIDLLNLESGGSKTIYLNELWYGRLSPYSRFEQYEKDVFREYVLVKDGARVDPGVIKISVMSLYE